MTEKEVGSLCSQLAYTYASYRRTRTPFTGLLFTSLNGRALEHLNGINDASYRRWKGAEWWTEDIDGLWNPPPGVEQQLQEPGIGEPVPTDINVNAIPEYASTESSVPSGVGTASGGNEPSTSDLPAPTVSARGKPRRPRRQPAPQTRASCRRESVVYLTADAEDELLELQEGETYVIGGIVDRNRYKNLCANKARDLNMRSARLPIGRYLADMPTRKVLTVNQVFDILVHWVSTRDWELAMQKVMPKRKFNANGKRDKSTQEPFSKDLDEGDADSEEPGVDSGDGEELNREMVHTTDVPEPDKVAS
ncbi:tRNA (guanine(9)-N(1))-methyltransferase [Ceratobasidium sp. 428]|nr:tRNA (guanine(9)-N(1))-methyltransferase [Ceratobasidium sp. 428]